jgi:hypothetical protein
MSLLREVWRRHWAVDTLAVIVTAAALLFAVVANGIASDVRANQAKADHRAARDRQDLCAILATIVGHVPAAIDKARRDFARPKHPKDCQPVARPTPTATVTVTPTPPATSTTSVILIGPTSTPQPTVTVTRTARPRPPHTTPSPSPSCVLSPLCLAARIGDTRGR